MKSTLVIVGNGMVSFKFCEKLVAKNLLSEYDVIIFGEEPRVAYDRVHLSEYFSDYNEERLAMAPAAWYEEHGILVYTSELVTEIIQEEKVVLTHHGRKQSYDKLVLATGSAPFVPPIDGVNKKGIFVYRTIEDLDQILAYSKKSTSGVVIGGGLLGLEAAKALMDLGMNTHVVEFAPWLMPRQLDEAGSGVLQSKLEDLGIQIHTSKSTQKFRGNGKVEGLQFADGEHIDTDCVVISAGIRPRDELARQAGIEVGNRGGVIVNDYMETSAPDIYAIGEVALHQGMVYGLVAPCYEMAEVLVEKLSGDGEKSFKGFDMSTKLKLIGVDVASFGDPFCHEVAHDPIIYTNRAKGIYKRINVSKDGKYLLGGVLVGDTAAYNMLSQYVNNRMKLPEDPTELIIQTSGNQSAGAGLEALPDEALICSCENVSKKDICSKVEEGVFDLGELKSCTKAGTGCGGCLPMVKDLMKSTMKSMGQEVKNILCEHLPFTRQEVFDLIKVKGFKTYNEVLDTIGKGDGCEICKPAVASLLASIWNDMILSNHQDTTQDTNDRFLANIQRGGTYSVVPRVPGGEITPEKLIVLGEVAKKYGLYTKITGGQRVDLFGAPSNKLPEIWAELIAAGFESGHAYGKSLRTVKSCVGSTWCRYGVQDSVSFAIQVEERYRGLRSPHKIKMAVSGCVRECAEAQSKDVGIIATEKGWNLYFAGNGGSKPQHATLFASDVDSETCIKYIDRLMMFYIKTAEPLQRTATWFNKLEGGLSYLQDVIINDSLGICDELEEAMKHHVNTYQCEWKKVVEDPALKAKFSHFINTEDLDDHIEFVEERGQKVPAPWK